MVKYTLKKFSKNNIKCILYCNILESEILMKICILTYYNILILVKTSASGILGVIKNALLIK